MMGNRGKFSGAIADMRAFELIVRCRRSRDQAAWEELRALVEADVDAFCAGTDTRWLVSVCDTYADYGEPVEQAAAMLVVLLINWEKMAWSLRLVCGGAFPAPAEPEDCLADLWDGVTSLHLRSRGCDMPENMFRRLRHALIPVPVIARIFREVAARLVDAEDATPALLNSASHRRDLCSDIRSTLRHKQWPRS
jgi:hypothetical protein